MQDGGNRLSVQIGRHHLRLCDIEFDACRKATLRNEWLDVAAEQTCTAGDEDRGEIHHLSPSALYIKLFDRSSAVQAASDRPFLSLSVMSGLLPTMAENSALRAALQRDQSISAASGEIAASQPGLYSPEQRYSIVEACVKKLPCAKPGGTQIHSAKSLSGDEGMS